MERKTAETHTARTKSRFKALLQGRERQNAFLDHQSRSLRQLGYGEEAKDIDTLTRDGELPSHSTLKPLSSYLSGVSASVATATQPFSRKAKPFNLPPGLGVSQHDVQTMHESVSKRRQELLRAAKGKKVILPNDLPLPPLPPSPASQKNRKRRVTDLPEMPSPSGHSPREFAVEDYTEPVLDGGSREEKVSDDEAEEAQLDALGLLDAIRVPYDLEEYGVEARHAATVIQAFWRGCKGRDRVFGKNGPFEHYLAKRIQSVWRGFVARCVVKRRRFVFHTAMALRLQTSMRGFA